MLRALAHEPREQSLHPARILALVSPGDRDVACDFGRNGIAGVVANPRADELRAELARLAAAKPEALLNLPHAA